MRTRPETLVLFAAAASAGAIIISLAIWGHFLSWPIRRLVRMFRWQ